MANSKILKKLLNSTDSGSKAQNQFQEFSNCIKIRQFSKYSLSISSMEMFKSNTEMVRFSKVSLTKQHFYLMEVEKCSIHLEIHMKDNGSMVNIKEWVLISGNLVKDIMENTLMV